MGVGRERVDLAVIGGGIVGLATAAAALRRFPSARVVVFEKEQRWGRHQSGRNSGVIHSGLYYRPGSAKARMSTAGNRSLVAYAREKGVRHEICGKLVVATERAELQALAELEDRGRANGLAIERLGPAGIREREPHVVGLAGLFVPSTGVVDFGGVCDALAADIVRDGGELRLGTEVVRAVPAEGGIRVELQEDRLHARFAVVCAGLQSDLLGRRSGVEPEARIVPVRGEYYELVHDRRELVRNLVYPVPNPAFPFLGVHFTRGVDGVVHAGPNAVIAMAREGYAKRDVNLTDVGRTLAYPGFWRLARAHGRDGLAELRRSVSKAAFVRSLQRLVPELQAADVVPSRAGVRAQALRRDGSLVDDFLFVSGQASVHVINAPSPAATASLEIGRAVASKIELAR